MRIDIITIFPELFESVFNYSIIKRAQEKKLAKIKIHNLRDYTLNKQKSVDDYQFGGGSGMVMNIQPIHDCIKKLQNERKYDEIIYLTPDGEPLRQVHCNRLSLNYNLIFYSYRIKQIIRKSIIFCT